MMHTLTACGEPGSTAPMGRVWYIGETQQTLQQLTQDTSQDVVYDTLRNLLAQ